MKMRTCQGRVSVSLGLLLLSCFGVHGQDIPLLGLSDSDLDIQKQVGYSKADISRYFKEGIAYYKEKKFDEALTVFHKALRTTDTRLLEKIYYCLGLVHRELKQMDKAEDCLKKAIEASPATVDAYNLLSHVYNDQHQYHDSMVLLERGLSIVPNNLTLLLQLANTYSAINRIQEALEIYQKLYDKESGSRAVVYNLAYTLKRLGRIDEALPLYDQILAREPDHAETHLARALAYLTNGDFKRGWAEYEWRWNCPKQGSYRNYAQPKWDGSDLYGKTILLHGEQGLGDHFQFIRYAQIAKERGGTIIVAVHEPLCSVIRLCPYIDQVITLQDTPPLFDMHAPLLSLPYILSSTVKSIPDKTPYLYADAALQSFWKEQLSSDNHFKIGICWHGNHNYSTPFLRAVVANRSVPLSLFEQIASSGDVSLYSLQKMSGQGELDKDALGFMIHTFEPDFDDSHGRFMDTAAVMKNLDLVITIDTSIAHLAGGLGVPVWVLLPYPADWRWMLGRSDSPWYPTMRLFRQTDVGDWESVMKLVATELQQHIAQQKRNYAISAMVKNNTGQRWSELFDAYSTASIMVGCTTDRLERERLQQRIEDLALVLQRVLHSDLHKKTEFILGTFLNH